MAKDRKKSATEDRRGEWVLDFGDGLDVLGAARRRQKRLTRILREMFARRGTSDQSISPPVAPARLRGRPSAKAIIAVEIDRHQKTPQRWPKDALRSVVARDLWDWLEALRRGDKTIPRVKNPRAMASLLQRNRLWPPEK